MIKSISKFVLPLAALAMFLLHPAASQAQPFVETYVALNGNDNNGCGPSDPCLTIQRSLSQTVAGGEIIILNPGFLTYFLEPITIIKSVHITNDSGGEARFGGANFATPAAAITIDANPGDIVSLRGLTIDGEGTGITGIQILQASAVHIQNCVIRNFEGANGFGIELVPTSRNSQLFVSDTLIYNNGSSGLTGGILVEPQAAIRADVVLDRVHLENNVDGLLIDGIVASGAGSHVIVRDSVMSGNAGNGIHALTIAGKSPAFALVEHSTMVNIGQSGIRADGPGATVLLSDSTITRNGTGVSTVNSGQLFSYGNNRNNNNVGAEGTATAFLSAF